MQRPPSDSQTAFERTYAEATARRRAGDLAKAENLYRKLLKHYGAAPRLREELGLLLSQRGRHDDAVAEFRAVIAAGQGSAGTYNGLALALAGLGEEAAAVEAARTAAEMRPAQAELQVNLGNRLKNAGLIEDAIAAYRRAIALDDGLAAAHVGLGNAHAAVGERDEAVDHYRRALEVRPDHVAAFYHLALTAKADDGAMDDALLARFRARLEGGHLRPAEAISLHSALGILADRRGDYAGAFAHFRACKEARRAERAARGGAFDAAAHTRFVDGLIAAFPPGTFDADDEPETARPRPLLIIGMPRSGTTLVEQILGGHRAVAPGGELAEVPRMARSIRGYPAAAARLSGTRRRSLAEGYLKSLRRIGAEAELVSDKMPQNFLHLGLIARLFPAAAVVHCRRAPLDTCLSCYFQNFASGNEFANDLGDLGAYYRDYARLMDHWRRVLPRTPVEVDYEQLVADPEAAVRRLLDGIGLAWDPGCLAFATSRRPVLTASQLQVRQAIHGGSVGRWRPYRPYLSPLIAALGAAAEE